ncbi:MAG: 4Fe-4S binding protein [bacterium JZ-2024 1]
MYRVTRGAVAFPGSSLEYHTGAWRMGRIPAFVVERCTDCRICLDVCPEGIIVRREAKRYEIDPNYCKGCGLCAAECPKGAFVMVEEQ